LTEWESLKAISDSETSAKAIAPLLWELSRPSNAHYERVRNIFDIDFENIDSLHELTDT
jgi:hypothetical protein